MQVNARPQKVRLKVIRYFVLCTLLFIAFLIARKMEWQGNKMLHSLMEVIATFLALIVGILALIRFYTKKINIFLFIGAGFLGTAFLDGYHALVTSAFFDLYFPSPPTSLIPWSWVASRAFLSFLMALSWWVSFQARRHGDLPQLHVSEWFVFTGMGAATLLSFFFFVFYPLPRAYYPELFFGRPEEFVPAIFFGIALLGYLKLGDWREDAFHDWLIISLIVGFMGQVMFMSLSFRLFDTMFDAAHLLKKISYICMMQGLFIAMFDLFKQAESGESDLERALEGTQAATLQGWKDKKALKEEQGKLDKQKKFFESVVESSPNGIVMVDGKNEIILVNQMTEALFGYSRSELLKQPVEILIPHQFSKNHPKHMKAFHKAPSTRMMGGGLPKRDIFAMRKDGSEFPVEIGLSVIQRDEEETFVMAMIVDISERSATEKRLEEERKALEKSNLELDSFVYTASHDLRAPLRGINSFSKFIEEDYADAFDDEGRDYLARIRRGVGRMTQLIDDLLTLSRVSRQKNPYEAVKITELIQSVTERMEFDLEEASVDLVIPENLPEIRCDRIKITEVFLNLINNAVKFSRKNKEGDAKVVIGYEEKEENHQFSVTDNGIGIDPKYHERIFGIFQRLHTNEEYEGTGAGLSIVKRVIDDHKGQIWIASELGKGATFHFEIPKKPEAECMENSKTITSREE
ncbi:MAG: PAS domain S-box protein [Nitrospirae bacterium]|nr:PAS domain S-box protein [Candidatus Manganitrophaceae bacterium]